MRAKRNLGGSDPVSRFGRQNRTNTRVAPAQIEVFVRGLFADHASSNQVCDPALARRGTEHERHILGRTLRVFQCSGSDRNRRAGGWTQCLSFGV